VQNTFDTVKTKQYLKHKLMKTNMGNADRLIRILVVLCITIFFITGTITGTLAIVLLSVAGIFFLTSLFGICPLYSLLGISSCPTRKA
jgi:hypothetical protein